MGAPATLPAGFFDNQAPQSLPKGFFSRQPAPQESAQPKTTWQKISAGSEDFLKGLGEGALQTVGGVSTALNKIPYVGEKLAPSSGLASMRQLATPANTLQRIGAGTEQIGELALAPELGGETLAPRLALAAAKGGLSETAHEAGQGSGRINPLAVGGAAAGMAAIPAGSAAARPAARFISKEILPSVEHVPWAGRAMRIAATAPTLPKAIARGASTGAAIGGIEGSFRGRGLRDALEGGLIGGATGGLLHGVNRLSELPGAEEKAPYTPLTQSPNYANIAAGRKLAMKEALDKVLPGRVGSPQQESGYYPSVTKVPIRPQPPYKLTPESIPGPDTAGKGNLLSPLAKKGDPRAAQELMRRGRNVLYVPAESYPAPREVTTFGAQESPLETTQLGGSKHSSIVSRLGEGTKLGEEAETPNSRIGLGPPLTRAEIQRAAAQLPPETSEEANRRRYITAQIRRLKMK